MAEDPFAKYAIKAEGDTDPFAKYAIGAPADEDTFAKYAIKQAAPQTIITQDRGPLPKETLVSRAGDALKRFGDKLPWDVDYGPPISPIEPTMVERGAAKLAQFGARLPKGADYGPPLTEQPYGLMHDVMGVTVGPVADAVKDIPGSVAAVSRSGVEGVSRRLAAIAKMPYEQVRDLQMHRLQRDSSLGLMTSLPQLDEEMAAVGRDYALPRSGHGPIETRAALESREADKEEAAWAGVDARVYSGALSEDRQTDTNLEKLVAESGQVDTPGLRTRLRPKAREFAKLDLDISEEGKDQGVTFGRIVDVANAPGLYKRQYDLNQANTDLPDWKPVGGDLHVSGSEVIEAMRQREVRDYAQLSPEDQKMWDLQHGPYIRPGYKGPLRSGLEYLFGKEGDDAGLFLQGEVYSAGNDPVSYVGGPGLTQVGRLFKGLAEEKRWANLSGRAIAQITEDSKIGKAIIALAGEVPFDEAVAAAHDAGAVGVAEKLRTRQADLLSFAGVPIITGRPAAAVYEGAARLADSLKLTPIAGKARTALARAANEMFGSVAGLPQVEQDIILKEYFSRQKMMKLMGDIVAQGKSEQSMLNQTAMRLGLDQSEQNRALQHIWEHQEIDSALANGRITHEQHGLLKGYVAENNKALEEAERLGLKLIPRDNTDIAYVHHRLTQKAMDWINENEKGIDFHEKTQKFLSRPSFLEDIERKAAVEKKGIGTKRLMDMGVTEANERAWNAGMPRGIDFFDTDPVQAQTAYRAAFLQGKSSAQFLDDAKRLWWKPVAVGEAAPEGMRLMGPGRLAGGAMPEAIADFTMKLEHGTSPGQLGKIAKGWKGLHNYWSAWNLAPRPGFNMRNAVGNFWNSSLGGVWEPGFFRSMMDIQMLPDEKLAQIRLTNVKGETRSLLELKNSMEETGARKSGLFQGGRKQMLEEVSPEASRPALQQMFGTPDESLLKRVGRSARAILPFVPTSTAENNIALKMAQFTGGAIEENARGGHFIGRWMKFGDSPEMAALSVKNHLFDYQERTGLDRSLTMAAPYWMWTKQNAPLQLVSMFEKPQYLSRLAQLKENLQFNVPGGTVDEDMLPEYARAAFPIQRGRKGDMVRYTTASNYVPAQDLEKAFHPISSAFDLISPPAKILAEAATGYDIHKLLQGKGLEGSKISGKPVDLLGASANPRAAKALTNTFLILKEFNELNPGQLFGSPVSQENPLGQGAKINLLPFLGPRALVRQNPEAPGGDRFLGVGAGFRKKEVDLGRIAKSEIAPLKAKIGALRFQLRQDTQQNDKRGLDFHMSELRQVEGKLKRLEDKYQRNKVGVDEEDVP